MREKIKPKRKTLASNGGGTFLVRQLNIKLEDREDKIKCLIQKVKNVMKDLFFFGIL